MSKENALRFMLLMDKDEELERNYGNIRVKYEDQHLSEEERDKIVLEEVIPLAKAAGFDLSLEDMKALYKPVGRELADEELDEVVGGRGEFTITHQNTIGITRFTYYCELAPDNQTFIARKKASLGNDCPDYRWQGIGSNLDRCCIECVNFKLDLPPEEW